MFVGSKRGSANPVHNTHELKQSCSLICVDRLKRLNTHPYTYTYTVYLVVLFINCTCNESRTLNHFILFMLVLEMHMKNLQQSRGMAVHLVANMDMHTFIHVQCETNCTRIFPKQNRILKLDQGFCELIPSRVCAV